MARTIWQNLSGKAFDKAWRLAGKPTLSLIHPISQWSLASGVSYEPHEDGFVTADGDAISVTWIGQPATTVAYLPRRGTKDIQLGPLGFTMTETTDVTIRWTAAVESLARTAWGVAIGDDLYRIRNYQNKPEGVTQPSEIHLALIEAVSFG